jgi:hypothetical protein
MYPAQEVEHELVECIRLFEVRGVPGVLDWFHRSVRERTRHLVRDPRELHVEAARQQQHRHSHLVEPVMQRGLRARAHSAQ